MSGLGLPLVEVAPARRCPSCKKDARLVGGDPTYADYACECGWKGRALHKVGELKARASTGFGALLVAYALYRIGTGRPSTWTYALLGIAGLTVLSSIVMLVRHAAMDRRAPASGASNRQES